MTPNPPARKPTRTVGLILAGGRARRLGGRDKALLPVAGQPLAAHVCARLAPQVDRLALSSNAPAESYRTLGLPVIADRLAGYRGPLAGIHAAALAWPQDRLLVVAVDLPFLPRDLAARLSAALRPGRCAYASTGHSHALAILFSPGLGGEIGAAIERGEHSVRAWLAAHGDPVVFAPDADNDLGFNLNTPEDLAAAEERLASIARRTGNGQL